MYSEFCKICKRKLLTDKTKKVGAGPICLKRVFDRYPELKGRSLDDIYSTCNFCFSCKHFEASKRGSSKLEKYKVHVIGRNQNKKFEFKSNDSIIGKCRLYDVFVDGNIIVDCENHKTGR